MAFVITLYSQLFIYCRIIFMLCLPLIENCCYDTRNVHMHVFMGCYDTRNVHVHVFMGCIYIYYRHLCVPFLFSLSLSPSLLLSFSLSPSPLLPPSFSPSPSLLPPSPSLLLPPPLSFSLAPPSLPYPPSLPLLLPQVQKVLALTQSPSVLEAIGDLIRARPGDPVLAFSNSSLSTSSPLHIAPERRKLTLRKKLPTPNRIGCNCGKCAKCIPSPSGESLCTCVYMYTVLVGIFS